MKPAQILAALLEEEVTDVLLASGRAPTARGSTGTARARGEALATDDILRLLMQLGGSRYVEDLSTKPATWTARVDGIGAVAVHATQKGADVQVRFSLTRRAPAVNASAGVGAGAGASSTRAAIEPPPSSGSVEPSTLNARRDETPAPHAVKPPPRIELDVPSSEEQPTSSTGSIPISITLESGGPIARDAPPSSSTLSVPTPHVAFAPAMTRPQAASAVAFAGRRSASVSAELAAFVADARMRHASDLHLIAGEPVRVRVAGALGPLGRAPLDPETVERIVHEHVPERLRARFTTEGSCDFALDDERIGRLRANACRQRTGYKACFRLVARELPTLASLGLPAAIGDATKHHQGLVVVTGPTGHGKTSTLAALVDLLNAGTTHHVITIEDPIEILHPHKRAMMSQREVGSHTKSFAAALRASLREDPDVIVVGELRDAETVQMALSASETGHLVLGTMNTPSAAKTVDRLIDLFPLREQAQARVTLAAGLRLVVGQRLVPNVDGGLAAVVELLPGSTALSALIREGKTFQIPSLQQRGKAFGIVRLEESLAELQRTGRVAREVTV